MRLACLMLVCVAAQAQTGALSGTIIDQLDKPIAGAYVSAERNGQKAETRTDDTGRFRFDGLVDGSYGVAMFASGWKSMTLESVTIEPNRTTDLPPITLYVADYCGFSDSPRSLIFLKDGKQGVATGTVSAEFEGRISFLKDVLVTISTSTASFQTRTDNNGRFRLEAPPGSYSFAASGYSMGTITILKGIEALYWNRVVHQDRPVVCE